MSVGLAAFLCGLGLARTELNFNSLWVVFTLPFLLTGFKHRKLWVVCAAVLGLTLGWWRGSIYMLDIGHYEAMHKQKVTIVGAADSDAIYGDRGQLTFDLGRLQIIEPVDQGLVGRIGVKGFGEYMVYKGDRVHVVGKLYPTRGSRLASISFAEIKVMSRSRSFIERTRRRFETGMLSALPEPLGSFGLGLLIGQRTTLPKSFTDQLSAVGLTHIVAVSGYNLTIILRGIRRALKNRSKYQSTLLSVILIGTFLLFTGFSASIVRAAIVSLLSLWAWYYGREFRPFLLLLFAAVITAGYYPIYLWSDIGWYLSFLAFYGVMIVGPLLTKRLFKRKDPKLLATIIIETSAAQVMTAPLIMYIFGQFSVIALIANILVVPWVSVAMLLGLIAGLGGMFLTPIAGWLALPARLLLTYMVDVVVALSRLPRALIEQPLGLWQMMTMYSVVVLITLILWRVNRGSRDIIKLDIEAEGADNVGALKVEHHQAAKGSYRCQTRRDFY